MNENTNANGNATAIDDETLARAVPTEDPFVPFTTIANSPVACNSFLYFIN